MITNVNPNGENGADMTDAEQDLPTFGRDDGPIRDWAGMSEHDLRDYAATHVGRATNEMGDPAELDWTLEMLDLDVLDALCVDWPEWHRQEVTPNPHCAWMHEGVVFHSPIVISIEMGEPIIWDGWHRIAHAKSRGDRGILAVVGRTEGRP